MKCCEVFNCGDETWSVLKRKSFKEEEFKKSMSKKLLFFIFTLLLVVPVYAQEDLSGYQTLEIDSKIISPVNIKLTGEPIVMEYIHINFSWIPVTDFRQGLNEITSKPSSTEYGDYLFFDIKQVKDFQFEVSFTTSTSAMPVRVREKIPFPIQELSSQLIEYTKPSELTDINTDIRMQAASLARGEDDLYVVVFNLADWVNTNIEYNLSTLTAQATLPSSWVLENRRGVCDELSNLFASMLRSLGIPARLVSGISYTTSDLFDFNWGAHGWVEVYFPDYGWIPFDPTYNQLGYVDATHIKMGDKNGDDRYNTEYTWLGRGFDVVPTEQQIESRVVKKGTLRRNEVEIDVSYLSDEVDFGSYNVVVAKVTNRKNYYVARAFDISRVQGLTLLNDDRRDVLFRPGEEKTIYWLVRVDGNLDKDFIYTFPISVFTIFEEKKSDGFKALAREEYITRDVVESFASTKRDSILLSKMDCTVVDDTVYYGDYAEIVCSLSRRNIPPQLEICVQDGCEDIAVDSRKFPFRVKMDKPGYWTMLVTADARDWKEEAFVSVNVVDLPKLEIMNLTSKHRIRYDEKVLIDFIVESVSGGFARDVSVVVSHDLFEHTWEFNELKYFQGFSINVDGNNLKSHDNKFKILVEYYDDKGKRYFTTKEVLVELYDLNLWQRLVLWLNDLEVLFK